MAILLLPLLLWISNSITQSKIKLYFLQFRNLDSVRGIDVECAYYHDKINIFQNYCNKLYKQTKHQKPEKLRIKCKIQKISICSDLQRLSKMRNPNPVF